MVKGEKGKGMGINFEIHSDLVYSSARTHERNETISRLVSLPPTSDMNVAFLSGMHLCCMFHVFVFCMSVAFANVLINFIFRFECGLSEIWSRMFIQCFTFLI